MPRTQLIHWKHSPSVFNYYLKLPYKSIIVKHEIFTNSMNSTCVSTSISKIVHSISTDIHHNYSDQLFMVHITFSGGINVQLSRDIVLFWKRQSISFLLSQSTEDEQQNLFINSVGSHCKWTWLAHFGCKRWENCNTFVFFSILYLK